MVQVTPFSESRHGAASACWGATANTPELSIVIPTFNERGNVEPLARKLDAALQGCTWEAIFVDDDSPDGTADEVRRLAVSDPRLRCIKRVNRRGEACGRLHRGDVGVGRRIRRRDGCRSPA